MSTPSGPSRSGVVTPSVTDIPPGLQRKDQKATRAAHTEIRRQRHELAVQESLLSQNYVIMPGNPQSAFKDPEAFIFLQDKKTGLLTPIGNVGSYSATLKRLQKAKKNPALLKEDLTIAHFCCSQLRETCGITENDGLSWLVPRRINKVEEEPSNQGTRDYTFTEEKQKKSLADFFFENLVQNWQYISTTLRSGSQTKPPMDGKLVSFVGKIYQQNATEAIAQLDLTREQLMVPESQGLLYLHSRDVAQKIKKLTTIVEPFMLQSTGTGQKTVFPGTVVSQTLDTVYVLHQVGKTYIAQLNSSVAKSVLSNELRTVTDCFCNKILSVSLSNLGDIQNQRQAIPLFTISFVRIPVGDFSNSINKEKLVEYIDKVNCVIQNQQPGDFEEALIIGTQNGIGDFRKKPKSPFVQTGNKKQQEVFSHISSAPTSLNYSDDSLWVM